MNATQPSRATITREEVVRTADALLATGVRPTAIRIREQLGRGSPNTIQPWLVEWRAGAAGPPAPIPPALASEASRRGGEVLLTLLQSFWPKLREHLALEFDERLHDALAAAKDAHEEQVEATSAVDALEARLAAAEDAHVATKATLEQAQGMAVSLEAQRADLAVLLREALAANARSDATARSLRQDLDQVRAQHAELTTQLQAALHDRDRLARDLGARTVELDQARTHSVALQEQLGAADGAQRRLAAQLEEERSTARASLDRLRDDLATERQDHATDRGRLDAQAKLLATQAAEIPELREMVARVVAVQARAADRS